MVLLLENVGQMVEQRNDGRHRRLAQAVIHVFQEILSIFIALIRCQLEPLDRTGSIFWDLLPKQIELAEGILGVLIALFRCGGEPADGGFHILWRIFPLEQQLAQPVLRKLITSDWMSSLARSTTTRTERIWTASCGMAESGVWAIGSAGSVPLWRIP